MSAPAHSLVTLGNLRKLRPSCAPQPPTQVLRLPGESLEHSSDRHPVAVFKHSEPRRAPYRHDPPLTPSRPQPKPPPHNARQKNNGHHRAQPPRYGDITIQRHVDMPTPLADIKAHTGADKRPASCCLRSTPTPRKMGEAFVATPQSHSLDKSAAE